MISLTQGKDFWILAVMELLLFVDYKMKTMDNVNCKPGVGLVDRLAGVGSWSPEFESRWLLN